MESSCAPAAPYCDLGKCGCRSYKHCRPADVLENRSVLAKEQRQKDLCAGWLLQRSQRQRQCCKPFLVQDSTQEKATDMEAASAASKLDMSHRKGTKQTRDDTKKQALLVGS